MIRLVVGLGNPGAKYEKTRHNAGFLFLDQLQNTFEGAWVNEARFDGLLSEIYIGSYKVMLLKSQLYMNKSGGAVGKVVRYFKLQPEDVLVVHDELDLAEGVVRLKKGGGHAGHNGLRDIIAHLGKRDFYRLRIGIGRPQGGVPVADYVLSAPSKMQEVMIRESFAKAERLFALIVAGNMSEVMNNLHAAD